MVSVICATYNQQPYIQTCLDAILAQVTNFDVEIIVHDDASTDGTADIVRSYAEQHPYKIRAIIRPERIYSVTKKIRLSVYQYARGRYVAWCDGDDFWRDPYKLLKQVDFLEAKQHFVISYHNADIVDGSGNTISKSARNANINQHFSKIALRTFLCGWIPLPSMMHRRVDLGYPPEFDLSPNSDNFLVMLLGQYGGAGYQESIENSAVRYHNTNVFSIKSNVDKASMQLQTHLQMVSFLLRNSELEHARLMLAKPFTEKARWFLKHLNIQSDD
jgi:glycosyltransferase involved in cell wall biosynthesis